MVDPPCWAPEPWTSDRKARTGGMGLRAPSVKKGRSSVDTTASTTTGGTWLRFTLTRFCSEKLARGWPESSYKNDVCDKGGAGGRGERKNRPPPPPPNPKEKEKKGGPPHPPQQAGPLLGPRVRSVGTRRT